MGKTRAECSQNAYTSHASAFLSHWIQILANSSPKSDIKNKQTNKQKTTLFFRILRSVGRGQHNNFFFLALLWTIAGFLHFYKSMSSKFNMKIVELWVSMSFWGFLFWWGGGGWGRWNLHCSKYVMDVWPIFIHIYLRPWHSTKSKILLCFKPTFDYLYHFLTIKLHTWHYR